MNTIEQAREVAERLRNHDTCISDKKAANTIDALIAELNDERMRCAQADNAVAQMAAELAAIKSQEPVATVGTKAYASHHNLNGTEWIEPAGSKTVMWFKEVPVGATLYLAAGAQPVPEGYALISIAMLRTWGVYEDVIEQCQYPVAREQAGAQAKPPTALSSK